MKLMKLTSLFLYLLLILIESKRNPITITKKCGSPYSIQLRHDNLQRSFSIYIPSILCNQESFVEYVKNKLHINSFNPSLNHQMMLPILIAIHCLGCTPINELNKWQSSAEQFNFILIAPQGIGNSWNADQCCGQAAANSVNDIGLIQFILNNLYKPFSDSFPFVKLSNNINKHGFVFITGFSNGGFMSDKIAWASSVGQFQKVIAVAPLAGYIYDNSQYVSNVIKNGDTYDTIAIYIHHSKSDTFVSPNGCCKENKNGCLGNLGDNTNNCLSVYKEYENWLKWNNCNDEVTFNDICVDTVYQNGRKKVKVTCAYATTTKHGCDALTSLCMHHNVHHTEWANSFAQTKQVMIFFLKALCLHQNGNWDDSVNNCDCNDEMVYDGLYCITPKKSIGIEFEEHSVKVDL